MAFSIPPGGFSTESAKAALHNLRASDVQGLALKPGRVVSALVGKIQPVDTAQKTILTDRAAQASNEGAPPNIQRDFTQLMARNQLKLAELLVGGQRLVTVTDQPLERGQSVQIRLNRAGQLALLPKAAQTTTQATTTATASPSARTGLNAALATDVQQALRQILPRQGQKDLFSALAQLQQAVDKLPPSPAIRQLGRLLGQLERQPLSSHPTPKAVKEALQNSGTQLESRLARALPQASAQGRPVESAARIVIQDLKAVALQIAQSALQATGAKPSGDVLQVPRALQGALLQPGSSGATQLLQWMSSGHPPPTENPRALQTQLLLLVHQLSLATLAKVRTQQLQPEAGQARARADGGPPAPLHFDIPIRQDGQLQPVQIRIEQREAEPDETDNRRERRKLWQVQIRLEPPAIGPFYAQLKLLGEHLSLTFFSPNTEALANAKQVYARIRESLEAEGMVVDDIRFREGEPAERGHQLQYTLVDVQT